MTVGSRKTGVQGGVVDYKESADELHSQLLAAIHAQRQLAKGYYERRELSLLLRKIPCGDSCPRSFLNWREKNEHIVARFLA